MDCSLPGSSVLGIFQARILEWVAISSSRRPSWPGHGTVSCISCTAGRFLLNHQESPSSEKRKMSRLFQSIWVHNFVFIVKISQKEWRLLAALMFTPCSLFSFLPSAPTLPNSQQPDLLQCDLMSALVLLCGSGLLVHPPLTCPPSDFLLQHSWTWKLCYSHGPPSQEKWNHINSLEKNR